MGESASAPIPPREKNRKAAQLSFCASARTLVLHAPLELGNDRLAGEVVEEGLRVDGNLAAER